MVSDCVLPLKQQQDLTFERVKVSEEKTRTNYKKLGELQYIMQKTLQRSTSMEDIHQQILLMENERKVSESSIITELGTIKQQFREQQEKLYQIEEVMRSERRLHEMFKTDMREMRTDINGFKDLISTDHIDFKITFTNKHDEFMRSIQKLQEQISVNATRLNNHKEVLKTQETIIETFKHNFEEIYEAVQELNDRKMGVTTYEAELTQIRRDVINLKSMNEDTYNSLQMTDNYLDRYLKIDVLNEIVECLFTTVHDSEMFDSLLDYSKFKYFDLESKIKLAEMGSQLSQSGLIMSNFNKVGYKVPIIEVSGSSKEPDSKDNDNNNIQTFKLKYQGANGINAGDLPIERSSREFDQLKKRLLQTQKALATIATPYSKNLSIANNKNNWLPVSTLVEDEFIDVYEESQEDKLPSLPLEIGTNSSTSPRNSQKRKMQLMKRPTFKKIIVNTAPTGQSKKISELKEENQKITKELVVSEVKHKNHQEKIAVLEDLDDELKEIVLQSSEQIEDIYKKLEQLKKRSTEIFEFTGAEDQKILSIMTESLKVNRDMVDNMQKDLEDDLRRRIREKSNYDIALKKLYKEVADLTMRDQKTEETLGQVSECLRVLIAAIKMTAALVQQDEKDKHSIQLIGMKMQEKGPSKKSNQVNSQSTGIFTDQSGDPINGGQSQLSTPIQKPILSLDRNCLSCSTQQNMIINSFKIACLQYQPQKVKYNNQEIDRSTLIERCMRELEKIQNSEFMKNVSLIGLSQHFNFDVTTMSKINMSISHNQSIQAGPNHKVTQDDTQPQLKLERWPQIAEDDQYFSLNRSKSSQNQDNFIGNTSIKAQCSVKNQLKEYINNRQINNMFNTANITPQTARNQSRNNIALPKVLTVNRDLVTGSQTSRLLTQTQTSTNYRKKRKMPYDSHITSLTGMSTQSPRQDKSSHTPPPNKNRMQTLLLQDKQMLPLSSVALIGQPKGVRHVTKANVQIETE